MKIKIIGIVFIVLTLCWMGLIFFLSSQNGQESSTLSGSFTNAFIRIFFRDYDSLAKEQQRQIYYNTAYFIRKTAHYTEYAILSLLLFFSVHAFIKNEAITFGICSLISFGYAVSDEFHQSFVAGRGPMITDVLIDTIGAITMQLFILTIITFVKIRKCGKRL